jgi:hypothetical protein
VNANFQYFMPIPQNIQMVQLPAYACNLSSSSQNESKSIAFPQKFGICLIAQQIQAMKDASSQETVVSLDEKSKDCIKDEN